MALADQVCIFRFEPSLIAAIIFSIRLGNAFTRFIVSSRVNFTLFGRVALTWFLAVLIVTPTA